MLAHIKCHYGVAVGACLFEALKRVTITIDERYTIDTVVGARNLKRLTRARVLSGVGVGLGERHCNYPLGLVPFVT